MFISLFNTLKATGVPCSLRELLDLIAAVDKRLAFANMNEFYFLSRAILVKDEKHYEKKISSMNLLVLHPDYNDFIHLKLPDMEKEAEFLIHQAKELSN